MDGLGYTIETEKRECEPVTWAATNKDTENTVNKRKFPSNYFVIVDKAVRGNS